MSTMADGGSQQRGKAPVGALTRRWYSVPEVAEMLGYGPTKVRMMCISGDLRSLKDGGSRRILPAWVDEYVAKRAAEAEADWP
jgi:excisionase family DNA binding protein